MNNQKLTKIYTLQILPNFHKMEDIRYSASRYKLFLQHFTTQLYYFDKKFFSTKGMSKLANRAQKQARGIVKGEREVTKSTGHKSSCPQIHFDSCSAIIHKAKNTSFDYWITIVSQWQNKVKIPAKSHRKLNESLRENWKLSKHCEVFKTKNNKWYVRVFVTKEKSKYVIQNKSLGIDVGIKHASSRSDRYLGINLFSIIKKEKQKQASRQRNKHLKKTFKSKIKQLLDVEVNRAVRRSKTLSCNLVIEHPKALANLKMGKLNRWARSYFGNRLQIRAKEEGVFVQWINPRNTSITCSNCGKIDRRSRAKQDTFGCISCGNTLNADYNAALNIARIGQEKIPNNLRSDKTPVIKELFCAKYALK